MQYLVTNFNDCIYFPHCKTTANGNRANHFWAFSICTAYEPRPLFVFIWCSEHYINIGSHTVKAHQSHVHHDVPSNAFVQNADDLASYTVALMQLEDAAASYHSGGKIWLLVKRKRTE